MFSWQVQQAIYSKLNNDATLAAMIEGVFDAVPDNQALPYVVIGEGTELPDDMLIEAAATETVNVHVWSQYKGMRELKLIMARIKELLHNAATVSVSGAYFVQSVLEFSETFRDPGGDTVHGVMRFRVAWMEL